MWAVSASASFVVPCPAWPEWSPAAAEAEAEALAASLEAAADAAAVVMAMSSIFDMVGASVVLESEPWSWPEWSEWSIAGICGGGERKAGAG